jgi:hypothetical protein
MGANQQLGFRKELPKDGGQLLGDNILPEESEG